MAMTCEKAAGLFNLHRDPATGALERFDRHRDVEARIEMLEETNQVLRARMEQLDKEAKCLKTIVRKHEVALMEMAPRGAEE